LKICSWFNRRLIRSRKQAKSIEERRQFWEMAIETWKDSGLSISKFCEAGGLPEGTFYGW